MVALVAQPAQLVGAGRVLGQPVEVFAGGLVGLLLLFWGRHRAVVAVADAPGQLSRPLLAENERGADAAAYRPAPAGGGRGHALRGLLHALAKAPGDTVERRLHRLALRRHF